MRDRSLDRLFLRFRDHADGAALAALFDATAPGLLGVARHLVRDATEAEDLVQTTFLTAIGKSRRYDGASPVPAWLHGILWREAAKSRRRAARRVDPARIAPREPEEPIDELVAAEVPAAVARALERLPAPYREVLEPHVREGRGADEIAAALGRSAGTVRSQIQRGLERLRRGLPGGAAAFQGVAAVQVGRLTRVRSEVLAAAGVPAGTAIAVTGASSMLGGILMSKLVLTACLVVVAAVSGTWIGFQRGIVTGRALAASDDADGEFLESAPEPVRLATVGPEAEEPASRGARERETGAPAVAPTPAAVDPVAYWLGRFNEAPDDWRHGWKIAAEIARLPDAESLRLMTALWPSLSVPVKEQALKPFVFEGGKANALPILDLAATDGEMSVQKRAFGYLESYAFQDFARDYAAYRRWFEVYGAMPIPAVLTANAQRFASDLLAAAPEQLGAMLLELPRIDLRVGERYGIDLASVIREAGGVRAIEIALDDADPKVRRKAFELAPILRVDENWLRRWVLPAVDAGSDAPQDVVTGALNVLADTKSKWAVEPILGHLRRAVADPAGSSVSNSAQALAELGDPSVIPSLIELLQHDPTGRLRYDVGYFGLSRLTGVKWNEQCDAAWWLDWWEKNKERLPPEVRAAVIRR